MAFDADEVTDDSGSPRPLGNGYRTAAFDFTQDALDTGGDITTPFSDDSNIEVEAYTPTNGPAGLPAITTTAVTAGKVVVTIETDAGSVGRIRLSGRG